MDTWRQVHALLPTPSQTLLQRNSSLFQVAPQTCNHVRVFISLTFPGFFQKQTFCTPQLICAATSGPKLICAISGWRSFEACRYVWKHVHIPHRQSTMYELLSNPNNSIKSPCQFLLSTLHLDPLNEWVHRSRHWRIICNSVFLFIVWSVVFAGNEHSVSLHKYMNHMSLWPP